MFLALTLLALWLWLDLTIRAVFSRWAWLAWMILQALAFRWALGAGAESLAGLLGLVLALGALWGLGFHAWRDRSGRPTNG